MRNKRTITTKANNTEQIRFLYKKFGQLPKVIILDNIFYLKKFVIKEDLDILPYQTSYIICRKQELVKNKMPNIVFSFNSIKGDFFLINIDKKEREFKSLSQADITWYASDLINKSFKKKKVGN